MPIPLGILAVAGAGAAGLANDYDLLETTILGSSTSTVTFSNLNNYSAYKHLEFRLSIRGDGGNQTSVRFNGDTGTNYRYFRMIGDGANVTQEATLNDSYTLIYHGLSANIFAPYVLSVLDFLNTNKHKSILALGARTGTSQRVVLESQRWRSNSAISSITFSPAGGYNFVSGSRFSIYGIK